MRPQKEILTRPKIQKGEVRFEMSADSLDFLDYEIESYRGKLEGLQVLLLDLPVNRTNRPAVKDDAHHDRHEKEQEIEDQKPLEDLF